MLCVQRVIGVQYMQHSDQGITTLPQVHNIIAQKCGYNTSPPSLVQWLFIIDSKVKFINFWLCTSLLRHMLLMCCHFSPQHNGYCLA